MEKYLLCRSVVIQEQGLLSQMERMMRFIVKGYPPLIRGDGLEPWTLRVGSVDSFGESFD